MSTRTLKCLGISLLVAVAAYAHFSSAPRDHFGKALNEVAALAPNKESALEAVALWEGMSDAEKDSELARLAKTKMSNAFGSQPQQMLAVTADITAHYVTHLAMTGNHLALAEASSDDSAFDY